MPTDFNQKYGLTPEPVLDDSELLSPDSLSSLCGGDDIPLSDVQSELAEILLIPQVPDSVKQTFKLAKQLYLFGRFEYGFYTVSHHYSYLAIEAAILCRWTASLPNPVTVQTKSFSQQMSSPSHGTLSEIWMATGRNLIVNAMPFPNSPASVLKSLCETSIIDEMTEKKLTAVIGLRNDLSHHESSTVLPPSTGTLFMAAEHINALFDSVPYMP